MAEPACREGGAEPEHVRQIVARIGDQGDRMADRAEGDLGDDDQRVEADRHREGGSERRGGVDMPETAVGMAGAGMPRWAVVVAAVFVRLVVMVPVITGMSVVVQGEPRSASMFDRPLLG